MERWIRRLALTGNIIGALVTVWGLIRFFAEGHLNGLFIALAIIVVGPVEDLLQQRVRNNPGGPKGEAWVKIIDLTTSITFLVLLGCVLFFT